MDFAPLVMEQLSMSDAKVREAEVQLRTSLAQAQYPRPGATASTLGLAGLSGLKTHFPEIEAGHDSLRQEPDP